MDMMNTQSHFPQNINVDVSKNFDFVTNFGTSKISTLMQEYIFEGVFPSLTAFISLRLHMSKQRTELMRKLLKLCFMCVNFKSKPIHETNIVAIIVEIRNSHVLNEIANSMSLNSAALGINP